MAFLDESGQDGQQRLPSLFDSFVKIQPDSSTVIQVLEPHITQNNIIWKHYIPQALRKSGKRGLPILCPGMDVCPICQRNAEIGRNREHPDYIAPQKRMVVNVLDRTISRECPLCHTINSTKECSYCGFNLSDVAAAPTDRVKLLERGVTFFQQLNALEDVVKIPYDPNDPLLELTEQSRYIDAKPGDPISVSITRFPITLITSFDSKGSLVVNPIPGQVNNLDWREYKSLYCDKTSMYITLTGAEINRLLDGGSLSEILKARNSIASEDGLSQSDHGI